MMHKNKNQGQPANMSDEPLSSPLSTERQYFGTDGIRGRVGTWPVTPDFVLKLGWAVGCVLTRDGLTGKVLIGKDPPEQCIISSSLENLDFITAGPVPPNPSELILNPRMDALIDFLRERYDIIIIDTPPVGIVSDGIPVIQKL